MKRILFCLLLFTLLLGATSANAAVVNSGFEDGGGSFSGWTTIGFTSIEMASFGSGPAGGTYQALLDTRESGAVDVASFINTDISALLALIAGQTPSLDFYNDGNDSGAAAIKQTFTASAGDSLSFDWNFLTNEDANETSFNDFALVAIQGPSDSAPTLGLLASTYSPLSDSATPFDLEVGYGTYETTLGEDGDYTLSLAVLNVGDDIAQSGLLVDDPSIGSSDVPVPEPSTFLLLALGGLGLIGWRRLRS